MRFIATLNSNCVLWSTVALVFGCGGPSVDWHEADGYRWRGLIAPGKGDPGFTQLDPSRTGIDFSNFVTEDQLLQNRHLGQGSGVALGDVDGDGLVDVYLGRIEGPNALYRNLGDWRFEEIAETAGVAAADRFTTGVTFADVDGDRDLDLLVAALGGPNSLFLNNGTGAFTEMSDEAGLDSGFGSTTMTLADVEGDGDLDLYVANYRVLRVEDVYPPVERTFERTLQQEGERWEVVPRFREYYRAYVREDFNMLVRVQRAEPDLFYLNDGKGRFERIPLTSGRFLDEDGNPLASEPELFNLSARFYDMDGDGDQDLYVCADFEDPDQIWINDGKGSFRAAPRLALRTTSNSAMAVDFADIDRDGDVDFFESDMMARDPRRRKTQKPSHTPLPKLVGKIDDRPQMMRNTLFLNRGDDTYAQIAEFAGVEAAGWSWSTFFLDVDLDGYEDILLLTGHIWDVMDFDIQNRTSGGMSRVDWRRERFLFPRLELPNVIFRNNGDLTFDEVGREWGFADEDDVSHGPAVADLDGDGDLDVVANRLGLPAGVYRNDASGSRVAVRLIGDAPNTAGVGSKIRVRGGAVPEQEKEVTVGGMSLSGSDPMYSFATGDAEAVTIVVDWKGGGRTVLRDVEPNRLYEINQGSERAAAEGGGERQPTSRATLFTDISGELDHVHSDSQFNDLDRQPLPQNTLSLLGPGISWYDVDLDTDEDLLITSGRGGQLAYFRNDRGTLRRSEIAGGVIPHDQTAVIGMPNGRGGTALLVGQSNYESQDLRLISEIASVLKFDIDEGDGPAAGPNVVVTEAVAGSNSSTGALAMSDYDADGDLDLFVGGRVIPGSYPLPASSRLLLNDAGRFAVDRTNGSALADVGLVSAATFSDVDVDGDPDLLVALEWGGVKLLRNDRGRFSDVTDTVLSRFRSRWNGIATGDFNEDGRPDIVATSWGRNTKYRIDERHPLLLYYADFDRNGSLDLIEAQFQEERQGLFPLESFSRIKAAMPRVQQRIPTYMAYADATLEELLGPQLELDERLAIITFDHMLFLSNGESYDAIPLPAEAQFAPSFYAGVADFDGDGHEDLFLTQNFFPTQLETPRYDAGRGLLLLGDGSGSLEPVAGQSSGIEVYGDQRGAAFADYDGDGRTDLVVSQNGAETKLYRNARAEPGIRVRLVGDGRNPHAYGATVRLVYQNGRGPAREIQAGSGYWSQNGAVQVLGLGGPVTAVWVKWPDGSEVEVPVEPGQREVVVRSRE
ncbi:MAG: hypothetical protein AMS18_06305 [Gemmatimonas sp. SG8_17]|nr:MAG: hypothetical protein AMS18_06305 [Gemmatimonas sp. SG8_17]